MKHISALKIFLQTVLAEPKPFQELGHFINLYHFQGGNTYKRVSEDIDYSLKFESEQVQQVLSLLMVSIGQFVLHTHDGDNWVGMA